jgi:hypothetical protein
VADTAADRLQDALGYVRPGLGELVTDPTAEAMETLQVASCFW